MFNLSRDFLIILSLCVYYDLYDSYPVHCLMLSLKTLSKAFDAFSISTINGTNSSLVENFFDPNVVHKGRGSTVDSSVALEIRGPGLESSHRQLLLNSHLFTVNCL